MWRIQWDPLSQLQCFRNFFHARNGPWIKTDGNLKLQDQGCTLGVVAVQFLPIPEFLSWLFLQYAVSHCPAPRELYFGYLMLGISVSKFHKLIPDVGNKDLHWQHARLETPNESHLQNSTRHTLLLWGQTKFFNDDFSRLMGTKPLFWRIRIAVIDPFFITCDNFSDKSIFHGITDKLMTDIGLA